MATCRPRSALLAGVLAALVLATPAAAIGRPGVAALQVALRRHGLYGATVDGMLGPATKRAVRRFQQRAGLRPTFSSEFIRSFASLRLCVRQCPTAQSRERLWILLSRCG